MRLLLAAVATLAAVAFAAPAFAQETAPAATPTPIAKPKPGTSAYCNTLKSSSSKSACLKRVHTQASAKAPKAPVTHKKAKKLDAPKPTDTSAQLTPPAGAAPASGAMPPQTINVPPLPQKTI
jgi:hypothetical protein